MRKAVLFITAITVMFISSPVMAQSIDVTIESLDYDTSYSHSIIYSVSLSATKGDSLEYSIWAYENPAIVSSTKKKYKKGYDPSAPILIELETVIYDPYNHTKRGSFEIPLHLRGRSLCFEATIVSLNNPNTHALQPLPVCMPAHK